MSKKDEPGPDIRAAARDIEQIRAGMDNLSKVIREEAGSDPKLLKLLQEMEEAAAGLDLPEKVAEYDRQKDK